MIGPPQLKAPRAATPGPGLSSRSRASYGLWLTYSATPLTAGTPARSSHLQPLNDGLDAGVGPNGSIERVREREIDSTDVRRGALHQPLDRRLPVAKPHEGVCDQVFPNVLRVRTHERLSKRLTST